MYNYRVQFYDDNLTANGIFWRTTFCWKVIYVTLKMEKKIPLIMSLVYLFVSIKALRLSQFNVYFETISLASSIFQVVIKCISSSYQVYIKQLSSVYEICINFISIVYQMYIKCIKRIRCIKCIKCIKHIKHIDYIKRIKYITCIQCIMYIN